LLVYAAQYLLIIQIIGLILSLKGIYTNIIKAINEALLMKERSSLLAQSRYCSILISAKLNTAQVIF